MVWRKQDTAYLGALVAAAAVAALVVASNFGLVPGLPEIGAHPLGGGALPIVRIAPASGTPARVARGELVAAPTVAKTSALPPPLAPAPSGTSSSPATPAPTGALATPAPTLQKTATPPPHRRAHPTTAKKSKGKKTKKNKPTFFERWYTETLGRLLSG